MRASLESALVSTKAKVAVVGVQYTSLPSSPVPRNHQRQDTRGGYLVTIGACSRLLHAASEMGRSTILLAKVAASSLRDSWIEGSDPTELPRTASRMCLHHIYHDQAFYEVDKHQPTA